MLAMDQKWRDWLDLNISRGSEVKDLYRIMRTNGFDPLSIQRMMGDRYPAGIEAQPISHAANVDYQNLANLMEVRGIALGAQRLNTELIQLYAIDNFLTVYECEKILQLTAHNLSPSLVSHDNGDNAFRTSMTCRLRHHEDPFVGYIDEKIARTLGVCLSYSEPIQAQHYAEGKEFKAHHDYFTPDAPVHSEYTQEQGQRTWTFMIYLNTTLSGGSTYFPYLDYAFHPKQGQAVIWNNLYADGLPNRYTLHHGMPVEEGYKTIITKWFRDQGEGNMFCEQMTQ